MERISGCESDYFSWEHGLSAGFCHHCNAFPFFQVVSFPQVSPPKPCIQLSCPPYVLRAPLIVFQPYLIGAQYFVRNHHPISNRWFEISTYGETDRMLPLRDAVTSCKFLFYVCYFTTLTTVKIIYAPNPTWTDLGPSPCLRDETPAAHRLSNCTSCFSFLKHAQRPRN